MNCVILQKILIKLMSLELWKIYLVFTLIIGFNVQFSRKNSSPFSVLPPPLINTTPPLLCFFPRPPAPPFYHDTYYTFESNKVIEHGKFCLWTRKIRNENSWFCKNSFPKIGLKRDLCCRWTNNIRKITLFFFRWTVKSNKQNIMNINKIIELS